MRRALVTGEERAEEGKVRNGAFVIMPFDKTFDTLHRDAIRPALEAFGLVPERYDDAPRAGSVLDEMHGSIDAARVVIAVLSGRNPHVFFELGITLARRKPCVLLAASAADVPDFLQHLPQVVYGGDPSAALTGLKARIAAVLADDVAAKPGAS